MMQQFSALFFVSSIPLLAVKFSMGLTQPIGTCHTPLCPLRLAEQGTLSEWH